MSNLADIKRVPVFINLLDGKNEDGSQKYKDIEVVYTLEGFAYLEEKYGSVEEAMKAFDQGRISPIRDVLYAGVLHLEEHPTLAEVSRGIDIRDLQGLAAVLSTVLKLDVEPTTQSPNK